MVGAKRFIEVSLLLCLAGVIACGNNRGGKVRANKGGAGDGSTQGAGQKVSAKFDQAVRSVVSGNSGANKPKPDSSFIQVGEALRSAYETALKNEVNQAKANASLERQFGIFTMSYPQPTEDKTGFTLKIATYDDRTNGAPEKFVFEGTVNVKTGKGELKVTKQPEGAIGDNTAVVSEEENQNFDKNLNDQITDAQVPSARSRVSKKSQIQTPPAAPAKGYAAHVGCLDAGCMQMIIKFIDRQKGFYPVAVKVVSLKGENQTLQSRLITPLAEHAKSEATKAGLKINENPGAGLKWSVDLNDAAFDLQTQITIDLVTGRTSAEFRLGPIAVRELDIDQSRIRLGEDLIAINPKK